MASGIDSNWTVAAALRDFAAVQRSTQSRWGYKRAAAAVRRLDRQLDAGALPRIHGGSRVHAHHCRSPRARIFADGRTGRLDVTAEDPARQDLDYQLADRAREACCVFVLDSDAHDSDAFIYAETAIAHARLAGIEADRVINSWELSRLQSWLAERRHDGI